MAVRYRTRLTVLLTKHGGRDRTGPSLLHKEAVTMETLCLVKPSEQYLRQIAGYRREFLDAGSSMDGCGPLRQSEDPMDWLIRMEAMSHLETLPEDRVLSTQFLCIRTEDGRLVGMIQVRHYFNDYLEKYAGHIGYSVRPSERRKGYGTWMLRAILPYCRSLGLEKILVCCLDTNPASRNIIRANGGVYESTVHEPDRDVNLERYWITL